MQIAKKKFTSYETAFAIGEHAELRLDIVSGIPIGRVEGIRFTPDGTFYDIAIALDQPGTQEWHSTVPLMNVSGNLLKRNSVNVHTDMQRIYPTHDNARFQLGDLVTLDLSPYMKETNLAVIPVLIWGVDYVKSKVKYNISIDIDVYRERDEFKNSVNERDIKMSIDNVDCMFITPIGGWECL